MKKAFTLIETMVALTIVVLGFAAILSLGFSAVSNTESSKAKTRATSFANGILEKFRIERDRNGIASFLTLAPTFGQAQTIDGIKYEPTMAVYFLDPSSSIVETNIFWEYKASPMNIMAYVYLPNRNSRFKEALPPYTTPPWFSTPTITITALPTIPRTPTPTRSPTPSQTRTPTPTFTLTPTVAGCVRATDQLEFMNNAMTEQAGVFTVEYSVIPNGVNGGISLSNGPNTGTTEDANSFNQNATTVRFYDGYYIDVRNGANYSYDTRVNWTAGQTYRIRQTVNVSSHTYSVYYLPESGSPVTIASNYSFRETQTSVASLNNWIVYIGYPGYFDVCGFVITTSATMTPTPTTNDLVGYWSLNESSSGSSAVSRADSSGRSNNLTDNNTVPSGTGRYSNAANFRSASTEYLSITDAAQTGLDITGNITLSAWIKPGTVDGTSRYIISKYTISGGKRSYALILPGGQIGGIDFLVSSISSGGTSYEQAYTGPGLITVGNWYHVAVVYNGVDIRLYINGSLSTWGSNNPKIYSGGIYDSTSPFRIGQGGGMDTGSNFNGLIDEVRVYNRALSAGEIQSLYLNNSL